MQLHYVTQHNTTLRYLNYIKLQLQLQPQLQLQLPLHYTTLITLHYTTLQRYITLEDTKLLHTTLH